jgi:5-methylcytosine-specific restriction endonuclease McrA
MAAAPTATRLAARKKVPWPARSRQRFLHCLICGHEELCSAGLCRHCYDAAYHSETYFGGLKEDVLERDGGRCRVCAAPTDIVHHRRPGVNDLAWLIAICAGCHAVVHRLQRLDRYLPPLLIELWREQHPASGTEQFPLPFEERAR